MAYQLLASEDWVHVLSTTETVEAVRATVQTPTHNVVGASVVPTTIWGTQAGVDQLNQYAFGIEYCLDHTPAIAAVGNQSIDTNGLLQQVVTFTVAYTPPGSTLPPLTSTVDVPNTWLEEIIPPGGTSNGIRQAVALLEAEGAKLQTMAGG